MLPRKFEGKENKENLLKINLFSYLWKSYGEKKLNYDGIHFCQTLFFFFIFFKIFFYLYI